MKKLLLSLISAFAFATSAMAAVDLNSANQQQLESVKGIGPAKAKAILEYRQKNGPFKTVASIVVLPPSTWREIQARAATLGITAALEGEGSVLRLVAPAAPAAAPAKK